LKLSVWSKSLARRYCCTIKLLPLSWFAPFVGAAPPGGG
jgi:hypothetical protein